MALAMRADLFPLTLIERRFWLWEHLFPRARVAYLGVRAEIEGAIDVDAWREAFAALALAPALRTRIIEENGTFWGRLGDPSVLQVVDHANDADVTGSYLRLDRLAACLNSESIHQRF